MVDWRQDCVLESMDSIGEKHTEKVDFLGADNPSPETDSESDVSSDASETEQFREVCQSFYDNISSRISSAVVTIRIFGLLGIFAAIGTMLLIQRKRSRAVIASSGTEDK